ncbi:hypothetical protein O181_076875 [Austropuccinia psidii MF-1]|uniref:Uncharacterized protein n=1 Tax=Austropuccinia psidii MF-1 TaxID=1389203 RepID=A0A9Q3IFG2_9BASI|nr:hypothetical protein [Austropuccinia psidii MF-1]
MFTPLPPHNCVQYRFEGHIHYGLIDQIYKYDHPKGTKEHALRIHPIINRFPKDPTSPSKTFQFLCYLMKLVIGECSEHHILISPSQVDSLMAYRYLDPGIFGIHDNGIAMVPDDHLGYLSINEESSVSLF